MEHKDHVVAIIQGRMTSSRLPGKVLLDIAGKPMLLHVVERTRRAKMVNEVVVATTTQPEDDAIEVFCQQAGILVFRGSLHDVLDRFYQTAKHFHADVVVRLTADCPVIDPELIDLTITEFYRSGADFSANRLPPPFKRTYPIGLDVEVCSFTALERAWKEAEQLFQREHVMPYLYDTPGRFKVQRVEYEHDYSTMRWTVDTAEDLKLLRLIFACLVEHPDFTWLDVLELCENDPELLRINASVTHKTYLEIDERHQGRS
jgi:spore coat polysaccharide biosynthesis protein SpsF